jgi:hypothetical protein
MNTGPPRVVGDGHQGYTGSRSSTDLVFFCSLIRRSGISFLPLNLNLLGSRFTVFLNLTSISLLVLLAL